MSRLSFLTQEQLFGDEKLDIFKKRGTKAALTDFAILLGAKVTNQYLDNNKSLDGRAGFYWTKSNDENNTACIVSSTGKEYFENVRANYGAARPVLQVPSLSTISNIGKNIRRGLNAVPEVEYGYYPQTAETIEMQEILDHEYAIGNMSKTKNTYTNIYSGVKKDNESNSSSKTKTLEEYEYNGNRYVRVEIDSYDEEKSFVLSNGEEYKNGDHVWIKVEPVKWLVNEKTRTMVTEKLIFAGVDFDKINKEQEYSTADFDRTIIKTFMDRHFFKDLIQSLEKEKQAPIINGTSKRNENPYNFKFNDVSEKDIIKGALESNVSVFLHGKPGCGKSDRVRQLDPDFIELNLSHLDPELLDGLAGEKDGKAVHIKPPWLKELETKCEEEADKIHILFLEELTNASQMMQSKAYGIALDKKVAGRWKLPENARVVAAGNEIEDSLVANEIAEPLYDRFAHVNIETSVKDWLEWAVTPDVYYEKLDYKRQDEPRPKTHPAIYAYVAYKGDEVLRTPYNKENPQPHADPRRWKMASDMLYATNNPNTLKAIVGEELTRDFISFCMMPTIAVEDVIKGNYTNQDLKMELGRQLATVSGLIKVDEKNMPKVRNFVKKLGPEMCKKFEVQWAAGDEERLEQIQEIRLKEKEKAEKRNIIGHSAEEAFQTITSGISGFKKVFGKYQEYTAKKENKKNELIDK